MTTILTQAVARLLFLPILMVAFATLIKGYADTGDGFTAGVIAALAVLLQFLAFGEREVARQLPIRYAPTAAFVGLTIALVVAFLPVLRGEPILTHAPAPGEHVVHLGSLELLTAVVFDVGVFLLVLGFAVTTFDLIAKVRQGEGAVTLILSVTVAVLFGTGAYLILKHDLIRVAVGMVLISNAANLFIMSAGLIEGGPPIYPLPEDGEVSDPLVQSMTLTAIVIGLGVTALLLTLVYRVYTSHLSLDLDDLAAAEEREEAALEAAREKEAAGLGDGEGQLVAAGARPGEAD